MREQLLAAKRQGDEHEAPTRPADFGFTYPLDYVQRAVYYLELWGCLPDGGGWADQSEALLDDIDTFVSLRDYLAWEIEHDVNARHEPTETEAHTMRLDEL